MTLASPALAPARAGACEAPETGTEARAIGGPGVPEAVFETLQVRMIGRCGGWVLHWSRWGSGVWSVWEAIRCVRIQKSLSKSMKPG